jgi:hypothetical protein
MIGTERCYVLDTNHVPGADQAYIRERDFAIARLTRHQVINQQDIERVQVRSGLDTAPVVEPMTTTILYDPVM